MRYIISDIHGCKKQYLELLEKINFSKQDHLYILGDSVDRGEQSIEVLQYIMEQKNITYLLGNHDYTLYMFIKELGLYLDNFRNDKIKWAFKFWKYDGGLPTIEGFLTLTEYEKKKIYKFLENAHIYEEIEHEGKRYILSHAGIMNFQEGKLLEEYSKQDFFNGRMNYAIRYYQDENVYIVSGHTPTFHIRKDRKPLVFQGNGHIAVDCGCVYGGRLAAYCVETGESTYVNLLDEKAQREHPEDFPV